MKKNGKIEKWIWKRKVADGNSFSKIEKIKKIKGRKRNFDFEELPFFTWMCNGIQTFTEYAQILGKKNTWKKFQKFYIIMTPSQKIESKNFQAFSPQCLCKQQLEFMKFKDLCLYP